MKKVYAAAAFCMLSFGFFACGPSAEERKADSLSADSDRKEIHSTENHLIDSINQAMSMMGNSDSSKKDSAKK